MRLRPTLLVLATVIALVTAVPARAQQPPPATLAINQLDAASYPGLRAVVTVLDQNGVPVPNLAQQQFQAFDGTTPLAIDSVQRAQDATLPLSVVLAIDVSGSMAGDPLNQAKQAAAQFVAALGDNDQVAVVIFNQQVTTVVPFTNDRARLTDGFAALQAGGGTALYQAVQASAYAARSFNSPRRAVVFLTDGQNDTPDTTATADGSIAAAKAAGVPVFTVGFGGQPDAQYLQALSSATSGEYLPATATNVGAVYQSIATLLRNQYVVTLKATLPADGKQASLRLVANVAAASAEATAAYQRGVAPAQPTVKPQPTAAPAATTTGGGGGSRTPLMVFSAIVLVAVAGGGGYLLMSWQRRRRLLAQQLAVTAPNPAHAAEQGVPLHSGTPLSDRGSLARGCLVALTGDNAGTRFGFGVTPIALGSDPKCEVRLEHAEEVAPRHALVWIKDGKMMLRHVGGPRRSTLVGARPVDWVILDEGDELTVGANRYRAELLTPAG